MKKILKIFTISTMFLAVSGIIFSVEADEPIVIPVEGDFWGDLFGEGITLNIFNPSNFEGEAGFWSLVVGVLQWVFPLLFIASLAFIAIGAIKMQSSAGDTGKYESGKKTVINAVIGFLSVIFFILIGNLVTMVIGIGNIFSLSQNLATCGEDSNKQTLYQWKQDHPDYYNSNNCKCSNGSWSCSLEVENVSDPPNEYK